MFTVTSAREYLARRGMLASDEWLAGCVEFLRSEMAEKSLEKLCAVAENQWLLSDLREICPGCLPANLANAFRVELEGVYALQMNSLVDIGVPAYRQLQKLSQVDTVNVEATEEHAREAPSQRMFKLALTDGVQDIHAVEYKPIRNLKSDISPGAKVLIKGPIVCRRGVLMMEEKHLTILGGEVEDLLENNNYKNILYRKINQDPSSRPLFTREAVKPIDALNYNSRQTNRHVGTPIDVDSVEIDDMFVDNFDLSELEAVEHRALETARNRTPEEVDHKTREIANEEPIVINDSDHEYDEIFAELEENIVQHPIKVNKEPYVYIKQLLELRDDEKINNVYVVKAQILKVIGKLSLQKNIWVLKCIIIDGSGELQVDVESDVLSKLIGHTPEEMINIKKQIGKKPELKQQIIKDLDNAMSKILSLDSLLYVKCTNEGPRVIEMEQITEEHIKQLKRRKATIS